MFALVVCNLGVRGVHGNSIFGRLLETLRASPYFGPVQGPPASTSRCASNLTSRRTAPFAVWCDDVGALRLLDRRPSGPWWLPRCGRHAVHVRRLADFCAASRRLCAASRRLCAASRRLSEPRGTEAYALAVAWRRPGPSSPPAIVTLSRVTARHQAGPVPCCLPWRPSSSRMIGCAAQVSVQGRRPRWHLPAVQASRPGLLPPVALPAVQPSRSPAGPSYARAPP